MYSKVSGVNKKYIFGLKSNIIITISKFIYVKKDFHKIYLLTEHTSLNKHQFNVIKLCNLFDPDIVSGY